MLQKNFLKTTCYKIQYTNKLHYHPTPVKHESSRSCMIFPGLVRLVATIGPAKSPAKDQRAHDPISRNITWAQANLDQNVEELFLVLPQFQYALGRFLPLRVRLLFLQGSKSCMTRLDAPINFVLLLGHAEKSAVWLHKSPAETVAATKWVVTSP